MDTTPAKPSIIDWLASRGLHGLPTEYLCTTAHGGTTFHHPDGCTFAAEDSAPVYAVSAEPRLCGCALKDVIDGQQAAEFFHRIRALANGESFLARALYGAGYNVRGEFPQLAALAIRHHRFHAARQTPWPGLLAAAELFTELPAVEAIRLRIVAAWDAAEAGHPLDPVALRAETIRYVARSALSLEVLREAMYLGLQVHNGIQQLAWNWLSKPVNGTLLEEYFSEAGDDLRKLVVEPVNGSGFSLDVIDALDRFAAGLLSRDTPMACHVGSPDLNAFEDEQDARPLIVWAGLKARSGSVALGEYPAIVAEALAVERKERSRLRTAQAGGGVVSVICEDPGLEPHQWEIALTLWDDSFENDEKDPGPYRDQHAAIRAAARL